MYIACLVTCLVKYSNALTELNLKAISGRTRSNQLVIFLPTRSGRITISELPILRTTISDLERKNIIIKDLL